MNHISKQYIGVAAQSIYRWYAAHFCDREQIDRKPCISSDRTAMVALLNGHIAIPDDTAMYRVGTRQCGEPERWVQDVIEYAMAQQSVTGKPPGYELACAIIDISKRYCVEGEPKCIECPMASSCQARAYLYPHFRGRPQTNEAIYTVATSNYQIMNLDCTSYQYHVVSIEVGVKGVVTQQIIDDLVKQVYPRDQRARVVDVGGHTRLQIAQSVVSKLKIRGWCRVHHTDRSVTAWTP